MIMPRSPWHAVSAALCVILSIAAAMPRWLRARDDAVLLAHPRPPVPAHGRLIPIAHDAATMTKVASLSSDGLDASRLAPSFDMYYEALLDGCDDSKNVAIVGGTNAASWHAAPLVEALRGRGYCTLVFDHRVHGRSESPPGELTAELLAEDAAQIIRKVFRDRAVHVYGLSLGGIIGYYLALEHPGLVKSLVIQGMTSCFAPTDDEGNCDNSFHFLKWFFSKDLPLRLLGTELQGRASAAAAKMHLTDETMYFFRTLPTSTMTRTPQTWDRWRSDYYHERIREIRVPTLLLAGEHDALVVADERSLREDAERVAGPAEYRIFPGYSHFMLLESQGEERGFDLIADAIANFHSKHFPSSRR